jgi:hypothetical protein
MRGGANPANMGVALTLASLTPRLVSWLPAQSPLRWPLCLRALERQHQQPMLLLEPNLSKKNLTVADPNLNCRGFHVPQFFDAHLKRLMGAVAIFKWVVITNVAAAAQTTKPAPANAGDDLPPWSHFVYKVLGNTAVFESIMIYIFGIFVVTMEYRLLKRANATPESILRVFTITLIIVLSLTVLNSGSDKTDFTPIIGLFGTIIGYMLGSARPASPPATTHSGTES